MEKSLKKIETLTFPKFNLNSGVYDDGQSPLEKYIGSDTFFSPGK
jgi:hypothetical protein